MQRSSLQSAFTLIEMLTVMLVIAVLASLVLAVNGLVQSKAARSRADGEKAAIILACENYKSDNGTFPRSEDTDAIDPRVDGNPVSGSGATKYQKSSLLLYSALNGDFEPAGNPDFKPEGTVYARELFKPTMLGATKGPNGEITAVKFIQDPFGYSYGYSTAGAKAEEEYQATLRTTPGTTRPSDAPGYNPTFDFWSTGGSAGGTTAKDQGKWIKNW